MLNKAQVIGHVGNAPKISTINNGQTKVASFSVATTEKGYTTQSGVKVQDRTEWHNVVCFAKLADIVDKFVTKGSKLYIEGKMRTRSYENKNGVKVSVMEINADSIELLDAKSSAQPQQEIAPTPNPAPSAPIPTPTAANDDDLPF
jgi:single-strand DNA-binding protein